MSVIWWRSICRRGVACSSTDGWRVVAGEHAPGLSTILRGRCGVTPHASRVRRRQPRAPRSTCALAIAVESQRALDRRLQVAFPRDKKITGDRSRARAAVPRYDGRLDATRQCAPHIDAFAKSTDAESAQPIPSSRPLDLSAASSG